MDPATRGKDGDKRTPIRWLDGALDDWIAKADCKDAIRVLSGEPGSGKSSACAMLAARLARQGRRVLLVPLSRLNYAGDAAVELSRFVQDELGHDALERAKGDEGPPLVLILDGLDELAKAGRGAVSVLTGFVGSLGHALSEMNRKGSRVLLLLAGRPGAAGTADPIARVEGARLHVLRYRVEDDRHHWFDDKEIAELDQRPDWWDRFDRETGMPEVLDQENVHLDSLTDQPLLNWLLAQVLVLEGPEKAASIDGVHDLYRRLFHHVLDRVHRKAEDGATESTDIIPPADLERMLEEVAVAAWHGGGDRTVPWPEVQRRLEEAGLDGRLDTLAPKRDDALTGLLDSFFCRAHTGTEHRAVEFTHKSFGQFLTARRIAREVDGMHRRLKGGGDREDRLGCLRRWLALCGTSAVDRDLLDFLRAEVAAPTGPDEPARDMAGWRATLTTLFRDCATHGMPLPGGDLRTREIERRARNAEVALLAALNATLLASQDSIDGAVDALEPALAGTTLHRLFGVRSANGIARKCVSFLNLRDTDLRGADLRGADLTDADLTDADLAGADLREADLSGANLRDVILTGADLTRANLSDAGLMGADLVGTDLTHADLMLADLSGAYLMGADLMGADLTRANLSDAYLIDANLTRANLKRANLTRTDLTNADLSGANLTDADLTLADLTNADLTDAKGILTQGNPSSSSSSCNSTEQKTHANASKR